METAERVKIADDLLRQAREKIEAELGTPEAKATFIEDERSRLEASEELKRHKEEKRVVLEEGWRDEAYQAAIQDIDDEEMARKDEFIAVYKTDELASEDMRRRRAKVRNKYESEWAKATAEEVAAQVDSEELQAVLEELTNEMIEAKTKEVAARELLTDFTAQGIDTSKVEVGRKLVVYLGTKGSTEVPETYTDGYGYSKVRNVTKPAIYFVRKLSLTSRGEGHFIVDGDSLGDDPSMYVKDDALRRGTIIQIGRKIEENGKSTLDGHLAEGVPFYYDADSNDDKMTDGHYDVADVVVDTISALGIEHYIKADPSQQK